MTGSTLSPTDRVRQNPAMATGGIDGELFALDIAAGDCFGLDRIGTAIWALAAEPVRLDAIAAALTRDYDVDPDQCLDEVTAFAAQLVDAKLFLLVPEA